MQAIANLVTVSRIPGLNLTLSTSFSRSLPHTTVFWHVGHTWQTKISGTLDPAGVGRLTVTILTNTSHLYLHTSFNFGETRCI